MIKEVGLRAEIITNGVLLDDQAGDRLLELGLDKLSVSMDTAVSTGTEPFHTESVAEVQDNLRVFFARKKTRRMQQPEIGLIFVASKRNIGQLPALHQLAREFGATSILVSNLIASSPDTGREVLYEHWSTTHRAASTAAWNPVVELPQMDVDSEANNAINRLRNVGAHVRMGGANLSGGHMHCRFVHEGFIAITPAGDVAPCLALLHTHRYYYRDEVRKVVEHRVGNIHHVPLAEIWAAPKYHAFRDRVRRFDFSSCLDCTPCDYRETNQEDCYGTEPPRCGECLWAAGLVQCP
jgi:MoaA/NifB/PqqE/SkfB family radical SAM enzyme